MKIVSVVGARPNFMKVAPPPVPPNFGGPGGREMAKYPQEFEQILVHTGQHYDDNMSKVFFEDLELPQPDIYLGVGSGSHACLAADRRSRRRASCWPCAARSSCSCFMNMHNKG